MDDNDQSGWSIHVGLVNRKFFLIDTHRIFKISWLPRNNFCRAKEGSGWILEAKRHGWCVCCWEYRSGMYDGISIARFKLREQGEWVLQAMWWTREKGWIDKSGPMGVSHFERDALATGSAESNDKWGSRVFSTTRNERRGERGLVTVSGVYSTPSICRWSRNVHVTCENLEDDVLRSRKDWTTTGRSGRGRFGRENAFLAVARSQLSLSTSHIQCRG